MSLLASWTSKLLASLLASVLATAIITGVANQTVLSSRYLEGQLASTNSYTRLSSALSTEITKDAGSLPPSAASQVQAVITPDVLRTKLNGALEQLQAYYRGNGSAPTIDLSDLASQVQAAGVPVGQDNPLTKPIQLGGNTNAKGATKTFDTVRVSTLAASVVLVALLLAVSWERHRYAALPDVVISVGVLIGLLALAFALAPSLAAHYLKFDTTSNAFASIGKDLATDIAHDLGRRFGIIAGLCLVLGIGARVWVARLRPSEVATSQTAPSAPRRVPRKA